jgi:hypothetical protein
MILFLDCNKIETQLFKNSHKNREKIGWKDYDMPYLSFYLHINYI